MSVISLICKAEGRLFGGDHAKRVDSFGRAMRHKYLA